VLLLKFDFGPPFFFCGFGSYYFNY